MQLISDGAISPTGSDRIHRLWENQNLEEAAHAVLKHLGELKRLYLTAVEEKLLVFIKKEYGIIDEVLPNLDKPRNRRKQ
ncbi:MAG: hypothetical protein HWQ36_19495 [Nostoc sp. NMS2]|uniref:hypothetical protein n=1 Tax=Nostoc sp. NMS2 TaxID=2815389 RepID=UPI0025D1D51A|nr:hypothetical protein [Nostoc sp. NMS2]MBN3992633.1 hypothetical protein [Nostoc sp. NMS2]